MSSQDRQKLLENDSNGRQDSDQLVGKHRKKLADFLQQQDPNQTLPMSALLKKIEQRTKELANSNQKPTTNQQATTTSLENEQVPELNTDRSSAATRSSSKNTIIHFDQLTRLDTHALAQVLQTVEPRILLLALLGASPELIDRITAPLSAMDNRRLRRQMEQIGPLQLQDITTAQNLVAKTATQLIADGRIQWPVKSRFAATA